MISRLRLLLPTIWGLGPGAVANVALYRFACRVGLYRRRMPVEQWREVGEFFAPTQGKSPSLSQYSRAKILDRVEDLLAGEYVYFHSTCRGIGNPPKWFQDPFSSSRLSSNGHWSTLDEFSGGDIKIVWETSRFEWAPLFARAWCLTGDDRYLGTLNRWTLDWVMHNPANAGPNWKCGQEASIRLINLLLAARLLGADRIPLPSLVKFVAIHCARIIPTIRYAVAQNNNHGTSEAAALFVGGSWLMCQAGSEPLRKDAQHWRDVGRRWLENRVSKLVAADGSFSQYSVNYHRVLLDTLCQVELWRADLKEPSFSAKYTSRSHAAVNWLASMVDTETGDAPNLGANDGARLFDLSNSPYRDFRPTVQLASVLFRGGRAYEQGEWDEPLAWLGIEPPVNVVRPSVASVIHKDGGDIVLRGDNSWGVVRFARFRFRPSHADCLHFDLWHRGENILRDGGSFSYNTEQHWLEYFSGVESHNTVQFDGHDQMPRLGRFLYGAWLCMNDFTDLREEGSVARWSGAYSDYTGCSHRRTVEVKGRGWKIVDEVRGYREKAVLRWRLRPGEWSLDGGCCTSRWARIEVMALEPPRRMELVAGWESRHYLEKTGMPVLEIEAAPGEGGFATTIELKD